MYISKEEVAQIRKEIKANFKGCKISVARHNCSTVIITLTADFETGFSYQEFTSWANPEIYNQDVCNFVEKVSGIIRGVAGDYEDKNGNNPTADYSDYPFSQRIIIKK